MTQLAITVLFLVSFLISPLCVRAGDIVNPEVVPGIPVKNTATLVDLGAKTCVPCKLMAPILEELRLEYAGRAAVIFIDVWDKNNVGKAQAFKVMAIPTQIFYDRNGKEVFRHQGFFDKKSMVAKLEETLARP